MIRSWDDYMDALDALPEWMQYRNRLRVADMVATATQLSKYGVAYPHTDPYPRTRPDGVPL